MMSRTPSTPISTLPYCLDKAQFMCNEALTLKPAFCNEYELLGHPKTKHFYQPNDTMRENTNCL